MCGRRSTGCWARRSATMSQSDNKLLASLPASDYQRLRPLLRTLHLPRRRGCLTAGKPVSIFPAQVSARSSTRWPMAARSRSPVSAARVSSAFMRSRTTVPHDRNGFVQVADGTVQYLPPVLFERELARNGRFRELIDSFCSFISRDDDPGGGLQSPPHASKSGAADGCSACTTASAAPGSS